MIPPLDPIENAIRRYLDHKYSLFDLLSHAEKALHNNRCTRPYKVASVTVKGDSLLFGSFIPKILIKAAGIALVEHDQMETETLIPALRSTNPDLLMISCLLNSALTHIQKILVILTNHQIQIPIILGGPLATKPSVHQHLTTLYKGPLFIPKNSVHAAYQIIQIGTQTHQSDTVKTRAPSPTKKTNKKQTSSHIPITRSPHIQPVTIIPKVPDYERHIEDTFNIEQLWGLINPRTLYGMHLGFRGPFQKRLSEGDPTAKSLNRRVTVIKNSIKDTPSLITPKAIWQFFRCQSKGNTITIMAPDSNKTLAVFKCPRQSHKKQLCLADFIDEERPDVIGLMVVTIGTTIQTKLDAMIEKNQLIDALILNAIGMQTAEALAEHVHQQMRQKLGLKEKRMTLETVVTANYTGKRYSFGYSACPDLSQQKILFELLNPEEIGVTLTDIHMMVPEGSVSALVFHHPQATYF